MSFTVRITLGLALILATCGNLESASIKRHIREAPEVVPEYGTRIAQKNVTITPKAAAAAATTPRTPSSSSPSASYYYSSTTTTTATTLPNNDQKLSANIVENAVTLKTTTEDAVLAKKLRQKKPIAASATAAIASKENDETYEEDVSVVSKEKLGVAPNTIKNYVSSTAATAVKENYIRDKLDHAKKEEITTAKANADKSRAIPFDSQHEDIDKYTSEYFHNKNNVYTLPTSPDIEKYVNSAQENDTNTSSSYAKVSASSTPEYDYNYSDYASVASDSTTSKADLFDAKFKSIENGVKQNLEHEKHLDKSESSEIKNVAEPDDDEDDLEDFKFDEAKLINAAAKDNRTSLDLLKYKTVSVNNDKKPGTVHKDYTSENKTSIDFRSSYLKEKVIDEKPNDYTNQIPTTDQESSSSEFKENVKADPKKAATIDKQQLQQLVVNKTLTKSNKNVLLSNPSPTLASKEEYDEYSSIDPLTSESTSEGDITVYKRGSNAKSSEETSTLPSVENTINYDNKSFSIPPTGAAWTLAGLLHISPVASTTEQIRLQLKNSTKDNKTGNKTHQPQLAVSAFNYTTIVPKESLKPVTASAASPSKDATKATGKLEELKNDVIKRPVSSLAPPTTMQSYEDYSSTAEAETTTGSFEEPKSTESSEKNLSDVTMTKESETELSVEENNANGGNIKTEPTTATALTGTGTGFSSSSSSETSVDEEIGKQDIDYSNKSTTSKESLNDDLINPTAQSSTEPGKTQKDNDGDEDKKTFRNRDDDASSTEQQLTSTADYEDVSTVFNSDEYETLAPTTMASQSEEDMVNTTDSSEVTTIPLPTTPSPSEDSAFTTVLTTATTENTTETGAKKPANLSVSTTAQTITEKSSTPKATIPTDHVDEDENEEEEEIDDESKQNSAKNDNQNATTVNENEPEVIDLAPVDSEPQNNNNNNNHQPSVPIEPKTRNDTQQDVAKNIPKIPETSTAPPTDTVSTDGEQTLTPNPDDDNSGTIAAIVISTVGAVCLVALVVLLVIMRKRQKRFNHLQRCTPISLDDYSLDNVSVYNSVSGGGGRRKGAMLRASKRSYGNPAFEDPVSVTHPLNFPALAKFADNFNDIHAEFEEIPQVTVQQNELPEGCETKNRYANIIPLPETRVFLNLLDSEPNSDYINANYVTGPQNSRGYYIACQAPMQDTVDDFWRMVWEQQSKVILMLTNLYENEVEKCTDYLPPSEVLDCHRLFGDYQVTLKKREVKEKYIISSLQLKNMVSNSWREVTHLWYLGWPDRGVPTEANSIIAFLIEARSFLKQNSHDAHKDISKPTLASPDSGASNGNALMPSNKRIPVIVHCSPGTGRTGTVIACDIAIRDFEQTRQVDIPRTVYRIRRDRASAVQTKDQYAFIYKVLNLYATKLTGNALESP